MIEAAPSKGCYNYQKKSILIFKKFHLVLSVLKTKMRKIVTKYVVCYSNN